ncbi:MAG: hypothetical protein JXM70_03235 [Pirellulales bacterium]|nr:hypothetical protein [Pirellulales bacterium]
MSGKFSKIVVLCAVAGMLALAEQSWGEEKEKLSKEEYIEKALEQHTSFDFEETLLKEVVNYLSEQHDIEIVLDGRALSDVGLDPESPITCRLRQVKLRSALNLLLRDLDMTYLVRDEVLQITTSAAAKERLDTKVYAVTKLTGNCGEKLEKLVEIITTCIDQESWMDVGGAGSIRPLVLGDQSVLIVSQTYKTHRKLDALLDKLHAVAK